MSDLSVRVRTCETTQSDTAGHIVIKEDPAPFVVALYDCVQGLGADAVACHSGIKRYKLSMRPCCYSVSDRRLLN